MMNCTVVSLGHLVRSNNIVGQPNFFLYLKSLLDRPICGGLVKQCLVLWGGDNGQEKRRRQDDRMSCVNLLLKQTVSFCSAKRTLHRGNAWNGKRGFLWTARTFWVKRSFRDTLCNLRGDLVPDACSSVPTGTVLADRRVAVLDVPSSHSLGQQVNLLGVGPELPHTSNESPRSPWTAAAGLPLGRNISEKYGSKSTLEVSAEEERGGGGVWTAVISMIIPQITPNPPKIPIPAASRSLTYEPRSYNSLSTGQARMCANALALMPR